MYALFVCAILGANSQSFTPTPSMRIESVYQELERNRAVPVTPGSLWNPFQPLPSLPKPFSEPQYFQPLYNNPFWHPDYPYYYRPSCPHYWR